MLESLLAINFFEGLVDKNKLQTLRVTFLNVKRCKILSTFLSDFQTDFLGATIKLK